MNRSTSLWGWAGFGSVTLAGTLLHFLYDWTGGEILMAPFSGVNESTWEHMKLLYWPLFLFAMVQYLFSRKQKYFWCIKLTGTVLGLVLIPVLFYSYNGIFGESPDWVNIAIFYLSAASVFLLEGWLFKQKCLSCKWPWLAFTVLSLIGVMFVVFTFSPPQIPLFQDPLTGNYGI